MTDKERTAREPLMRCQKRGDDVKTGEAHCRGISFGEACLRTKGHPAFRWPERVGGGIAERGKSKWKNHEGERTEAVHRGGSFVVAEKRSNARGAIRVLREGVELWSLIR